ncbi:hypothetical protein [Nocardioides soli]|uniref:Uncharacterized protein n=1 Tax=Nocardioides soli TaxID=1036020 RepID=A0A7W4YZC8_9ACTN|nr:hypothetical protein [Nocardioides soli]MBB3041029.1 hypothetical protein [Nocardioides soli]
MTRDGFRQFLNGRPTVEAAEAVTAKVIRVDGGIHAVALDDDERHPIGPCRGPAEVQVGDIVLLIETNELPWVAQVDAQVGGA